MQGLFCKSQVNSQHQQYLGLHYTRVTLLMPLTEGVGGRGEHVSPVQRVLQYLQSICQRGELVYIIHILTRTPHESAQRERGSKGEIQIEYLWCKFKQHFNTCMLFVNISLVFFHHRWVVGNNKPFQIFTSLKPNAICWLRHKSLSIS